MARTFTNQTERKIKTDAIFESIKNGVGIVQACKLAGTTYLTFYRWSKEYPKEKLAEQLETLKEVRVKVIEDVFYERLLSGKASNVEYFFFLSNRMPDKWKNRQEVLHDLPETLVDKFKNMSVEQLQKEVNVLTSRTKVPLG